MVLHFTASGPAVYRGSRHECGAFDSHLSFPLNFYDPVSICFRDGTLLRDCIGSVRLVPVPDHPPAPAEDSPPNAVLWNDPVRDGPDGSGEHFTVQLSVPVTLYLTALHTMSSREGALALEIDVPEIATTEVGTPQYFEDLYAHGMSPIRTYSMSMTRNALERMDWVDGTTLSLMGLPGSGAIVAW